MSTLIPPQASHAALIQAQVLGVHWLHDDFAGEQGYGLHYSVGGHTSGITLLCDERSEHDAPLYVGDWVRLRALAPRRHSIVDNLTLLRPHDAQAVDWAGIALRREPVSPAQLTEAQLSTPEARAPGQREQLTERYQAQLAAKFPDVAAFLAALDRRRPPSPAQADAARRQAFTNGGW
jgi:hypothetical protein